MFICELGRCTSCGACVNSCPGKAIALKLNELDELIAVVDQSLCNNCGICKITCPQNKILVGKRAKVCYAAWAMNEETRKNSASGGVATVLYQTVLREGWNRNNPRNFLKSRMAAGVKMTDKLEAVFSLSSDASDITNFQNSKYVYSHMGNIYQQIEEKLKNNTEILFVGLPCQVAALKQYLLVKKVSLAGLLTVDLVCHGQTPTEYLCQHIRELEKRYGHKATEVLFRDPDTYTYTFTFTLKADGIPFYRKKVRRNDMYQIGYHQGITYNTGCYRCQYACLERISDITLADFPGVGRLVPCEYNNQKVSCILCNTEKGMSIIDYLFREGLLFLEKRPVEEAILFQPSLCGFISASADRLKFISLYRKNKNFTYTMRQIVKKHVIMNEIKHYLHVDEVREFINCSIPLSIRRKIKKYLQKKFKHKFNKRKYSSEREK